MKYLLAFLLLAANTAFAQTGAYADPDYNGEGIVVLERDGHFVTYFYTYGAERCDVTTRTEYRFVSCEATAQCPIDPLTGRPYCPPVTVRDSARIQAQTQELECDNNGQRWFLMSDPFKKVKGWVEGYVLATQGIDYPNQFISIDPENPFGSDVADVFPVARYVLQPDGEEGYAMRAFQLDEEVDVIGPTLEDDDYLFQRVFHFSNLIFDTIDTEE